MKTVVCFLAAILLTLPAWAGTAAADAVSVKTVLVLPFVVHDVENKSAIERTVTRIFREPLADDGRIRLLDQDAQGAFRGKEDADLSMGDIYVAGRHTGADYVVYGTVNQVGFNLGITVELIDIRSYRQILALTAICHGMDEAEARTKEYALRIEDAVDGGNRRL